MPCGLKDKGVTSISKELNRMISLEEIIPLFLNSFQETFECSYKDYPKEECEKILNILDK